MVVFHLQLFRSVKVRKRNIHKLHSLRPNCVVTGSRDTLHMCLINMWKSSSEEQTRGTSSCVCVVIKHLNPVFNLDFLFVSPRFSTEREKRLENLLRHLKGANSLSAKSRSLTLLQEILNACAFLNYI